MIQFLENIFESTTGQRIHSFYTKGIISVFGADDYSMIYINVATEHLELLKKDPGMRHAFTQLPHLAVKGIVPVYAPNRHLVLELRSENKNLTNYLQNKLGSRPVKIESQS